MFIISAAGTDNKIILFSVPSVSSVVKRFLFLMKKQITGKYSRCYTGKISQQCAS